MEGRSQISGDPDDKKRFQRIGVQTSLIFLLLLVLVPVIAVQVVVRYREFRGERRQELQANLEIARAVAETLDALVDDVLHQELAIGMAITSLSQIPSERIHSILDASQAEYSAVSSISWVTPEGRTAASSLDSAVGLNIADRPYFQAIAGSRNWVVSDLVLARLSKVPVFTISRGIRDAKGTLLGIVVSVVEANRLGKILGVERGQGGAIAVVDREGQLVYRYPEVKLSWEKRNWLKQYPFLKQVLAGRELKITIDSDLDGQKRIIGMAPVPLLGWAVGAGRPEAKVMGPLISGFLFNLAVLFLVGSAALLAALGLSRTIAGPLQHLQAHALALGRGEDRRYFEAGGPQELRDLARTFNVMAEGIRKREEKLREAHDELEKRVKERTLELAKANESLQAEINERRHAQDELRKSEQQLRVLSFKLMGAQEKERRYVAQELHDSIASNLAAIKISLENKLAQMGKVPASAGIQLEDIISFVKATINDLRRIMTDLRPAILDDLGILPTIQWHCGEFQKIYPNIRIETLLSAPEDRLAEPLEITIFRILQEAMHNVAKHSNADFIRISLRSESGIHLTIEDNGSGFDLKEVAARRSSHSGLGLSSMKERAELAGGKFYIESSPGAGTTIRAVWPA